MMIRLSVLIFFISTVVRAESIDNVLDTDENKTKVKILAESGFMTSSSSTDSESLNALGIGASFRYAVKDNLAMDIGIRQLLSVSSGQNIATNMYFGVSYSMSNSFISRKKVVRYKSTAVVKSNTLGVSGWVFQALASQYTFNTSSSSVNFVGFGGGTYYEYILENGYSLSAGGRVEMLSRESDSITPITAFIALGTWF